MLDWWVDLLDAGFGGAILAVVIAAFAVLLVGNAIIWPMVWVKEHATRQHAD